jgi:dolichol-phosphate mannosyltransferase
MACRIVLAADASAVENTVAPSPRALRCRFVRAMVVLPTYNEIENLESFLGRVRAQAPGVSVLVVDDDSPDGTGQLADRLANDTEGIAVLHRRGQRGLGNAYRAGFAAALDTDIDVIISMDADFSHDPASIPSLIGALVEGVDMVIGSRYVPGGQVVNWPVHRRWLSRWGNRYTARALGLEVRDCTSGFRAYRATAIQAIDPSTTTAEGYAFLTELVRRVELTGGKVVEVPITFADRERGVSKMSFRIIAESMVMVTRWGLSDRWATFRRLMRR